MYVLNSYLRNCRCSHRSGHWLSVWCVTNRIHILFSSSPLHTGNISRNFDTVSGEYWDLGWWYIFSKFQTTIFDEFWQCWSSLESQKYVRLNSSFLKQNYLTCLRTSIFCRKFIRFWDSFIVQILLKVVLSGL